jgi:hypothetical protein
MHDNSQRRRFPAPWRVEEVAEAFVVVDAAGRRLCFVYFDEASRGANSSRPLKPEAFKIAQAIAVLPTIIQGERGGDLDTPLPGPWIANDRSDWFTVDDTTGRLVCAVYVDHPEAGSLSWDKARRIANGTAGMPELAGRSPPLGNLL